MKALAALIMAAFGMAIGCATSTGAGDFTSVDAGADSGQNGFVGKDAGSLLSTEQCREETKQIYVLATDKALYRFYPLESRFLRIGPIGCPTAAGTFSMAIDRFGTAWVEFTDGRLFAVNTLDATCHATPFQPGQTGFSTFGMGYAKDTEDGDTEQLYVSGAGLAALDTATFQLKFKGSLTFGRSELTGLGSQLFAFSVGSGVIAGLDKNDAATTKTYRSSAIDDSAAFAFAQWGGDFWLFTGRTTSTVTRYSPSDDTSTVAMDNAGILIVGAGSSTCVPTQSPK